MGHAEDWSRDRDGLPQCGAPEVFFLRRTAGDELWTDEPRIGENFDRLVKRCGMERAVALIRTRVARDRSASEKQSQLRKSVLAT
jgi:hypothetical protein